MSLVHRCHFLCSLWTISMPITCSLHFDVVVFLTCRMVFLWVVMIAFTGNEVNSPLGDCQTDYIVSRKKGDTIFLSISLLNIDRFSQFFHRHTQLEIWNKIINKDPTSPQMCCYTTLWNINVRKSSNVLPVIDGFSRSVKAVMHSLNIRWSWREN